MQHTAFAPVVALAVTMATVGWLTRSRFAQLAVDRPNERSLHDKPVPRTGGLGLHAGVFLAWPLTWVEAPAVLWVAFAGLLIVSLMDDIRGLPVLARLAAHLLASGSVATFLLLPEHGLMAACIATLGITWLINLYNFMDGIDALAAMEAIFFCLALALFTGAGGAEAVTTMSLGLALAVSGFLYFNLPPARLFMGDLGSNYLGYILGVLGGLAIQSGSVNIWTLLVLLGVFIVDTAATLLGRMRAKLMWYHAHRSHAYQQAASRLDSHGRVVLFIGFLNVCWLLPLAWLTTVHESWGVIITVVAWIPLYLLGRIIRQPPQAPTATSQKSA